jgi:hypothetical protein
MNVSYAKEHGNSAPERHYGIPSTEKIIEEAEPITERLQKDKHHMRVAKWPTLRRRESCRTGCRKKTEFPNLQKMITIETRLAVIHEVTNLLGQLPHTRDL